MCPDSSSTSAAPFRCGLSGSCPAVPGFPDPFACGLLLCANFAILCGCSFRLSGILQGCPILSGSIDGSGRAVPDPLPASGWLYRCNSYTLTRAHAHTCEKFHFGNLFYINVLRGCGRFSFSGLPYIGGLVRFFRAWCLFRFSTFTLCPVQRFLFSLPYLMQSIRNQSTIKHNKIIFLLCF